MKSENHKSLLLRSATDLVIVDEAQLRRVINRKAYRPPGTVKGKLRYFEGGRKPKTSWECYVFLPGAPCPGFSIPPASTKFL
jgi:hypothetical protein